MRKIILIIAAAALTLPFAARAGVPEAVTYLKTQSQDDWVTQALVAAGENGLATSHLQTFSGSSVTDYAKRILAIAAVGQNPHTFAGSDLVVGLKSLASGGQLGDPTLVNDDAWGIIALRAASVPATDAVVTSAKDFLLANQNSDGGWAWGVGFGSDTNDTAAVLMALSELGYTYADAPVSQALAYVATQQGADGGFAYELPCFWPGCEASDAASTSWVMSALYKLKLDPATWTKGANTPITFLASLQTGDGSFKWQAADPAGSAGMTAYATVALSQKFYPVARFSGSGSSGRLTPLAELALSASTPVVGDGGTTSYTVTLENHGPNLATEVAVTNLVPRGFTVTTAAASEGEFEPSTARWFMARLNNYASATLTLALVPAAGATPGTVSVSAQVGAQELDIVGTNNTAVVTLEVPAPPQAESVPQVLGETVASCLGAAAPTPAAFGGFAVSQDAPSLAWYWDVGVGKSYCLDTDASVRALFESLSLGITNANLELVTPGSALAERLRGRLLLQTESLGEVWYVHGNGKRTYLPPTAQAIAVIHEFSQQLK